MIEAAGARGTQRMPLWPFDALAPRCLSPADGRRRLPCRRSWYLTHRHSFAVGTRLARCLLCECGVRRHLRGTTCTWPGAGRAGWRDAGTAEEAIAAQLLR